MQTLQNAIETGFITLTPTYVERTKRNIADTYRMLNKELAYSADMQNKERLEFLSSHITKLETSLLTGKIEMPK